MFIPYKVHLCKGCIKELEEYYPYKIWRHEMEVIAVSDEGCDNHGANLENCNSILTERNKDYRSLKSQLTGIAREKYHEQSALFYKAFQDYCLFYFTQDTRDDVTVDDAMDKVLLSIEKCNKQTRKFAEYFAYEYKHRLNPPPIATENDVASLREQYPPGTRVELVRMIDPYSKQEQGDLGTVDCVTDLGTIEVTWDIGSSLRVVFGIDEVKKYEEC